MKIKGDVGPQEFEIDHETQKHVTSEFIKRMLGADSHYDMTCLRIVNYDANYDYRVETDYRSQVKSVIDGKTYLCKYDDYFSVYRVIREATPLDRALVNAWSIIYYHSYDYDPDTGKFKEAEQPKNG